jgi:hypothetical protein
VFSAKKWRKVGKNLTPGSWPFSEERSGENPGYAPKSIRPAAIFRQSKMANMEARSSSQFVPDLYLVLSQDRLEAYRPPGGTDLDMLTNYFWNIDLIEALVPCMHAVELALRNCLHNALTVLYGTDMWFYQPAVLESQGVINLGRALQDAAQKPPLRAGKIVAALSFGFWVS